jgi:hypothetical protein
MKLKRGDRVFIKNLGIGGQVMEVLTRSVVVRYRKDDGELVERHFAPEDLVPESPAKQ